MASHSDLSKLFSGLSTSRPKTTLGKRQLITIGVGALVLAVVVWISLGDPATPAAPTPNTQSDVPDAEQMPVVLASVRQGQFDINLLAIGTVTPLNAVEVFGRVDGQINSIDFKEGQMVKAGDLLAQIDPRPFEVQLTLAAGN